eukprot:6796319-Heterocapsa_arctica.AAC.1
MVLTFGMETLAPGVLDRLAAATAAAMQFELPEVQATSATDDGELVLCWECNMHVSREKAQKQGTQKLPKFKCNPCNAMVAKIHACKAKNGNMQDTFVH